MLLRPFAYQLAAGELRLGRMLMAAVVLTPLGCDFGDISTYDLPAPATGTLTLEIRAEDTAAANALGWTDAGIPDADVMIRSTDPENSWTWVGTSEGTGNATVAAVSAGTYSIAVRRLLSSSEMAVLQQGKGGFIGEATIIVTPARLHHEIAVPASERRSLVISEFYYHPLRTSTGIGLYNFGGFIEIYNNADTTIFLDGKVIGRGYATHGVSPLAPCDARRSLLADPEGIWTRLFEMFPGSGAEYPLEPGDAAVIATDAIDHRPFVYQGQGLDLSGASFEFIGTGDADNPGVPNMINIGLEEASFGRGLFWQGASAPFIAEGGSLADLPVQEDPLSGRDHVRIPGARVLDLIVVSRAFPEQCPGISAPDFNRGWMQQLGGDDFAISLQRRSLRTDEAGRVVLQHTRASNTDFRVAPVSPGTVPLP